MAKILKKLVYEKECTVHSQLFLSSEDKTTSLVAHWVSGASLPGNIRFHSAGAGCCKDVSLHYQASQQTDL
jgi:hypothetical protein